jgi:hypothetical protein
LHNSYFGIFSSSIQNLRVILSFLKGYFGEKGDKLDPVHGGVPPSVDRRLPTREPPFHPVLARVRVRGKVEQLLAKWNATCPSLL